MKLTLEVLSARIDLLAYHVAVLENENAALRRGADILAHHMGAAIAERDARADREARATRAEILAQPARLRVVPSGVPFTRRRIA